MRLKKLIFGFVAFVTLVPWLAFGAEGSFVFPIDCTVGKTCWIANYVDLKPGKGVVDYACGTATYDALPGNQHKGTDIALQDMAAVRRGVEVRAVERGIVVGVRDGVPDINIKDRKTAPASNRACGNGVRLQHLNGLVTQYCHMKKGSISVKSGAQVEQGQRLGLVGLSGLTSFPHLHFQVTKINAKGDKTIIDPFAGLDRKTACGVGENPLWTAHALAHAPYQPTAIYNVGFVDKKPDFTAISQGLYKAEVFPTTVPVLVLWAEFFRVEGGDELTFEITTPTGHTLHKQTLPIKSKKSHYVAFSGLRIKSPNLTPGIYEGTVSLRRAQKTITTRRKIIIQ
ncbi:MAG: M23 family metallopeptidase [Magnetovibrio sp.]|nr:M23 family metallopeptidase [Magnetovibrio sp.]